MLIFCWQRPRVTGWRILPPNNRLIKPGNISLILHLHSSQSLHSSIRWNVKPRILSSQWSRVANQVKIASPPRTTNKMFLMWFLIPVSGAGREQTHMWAAGRNWVGDVTPASLAWWDTWRPILGQIRYHTSLTTLNTSRSTFYRRWSWLLYFPALEMWVWGCVRWQGCPYEEI